MTEKQIEKLIDDIKRSHAVTFDLIVKLERAVRGENPVGDVMAFFNELWMNRYTLGIVPAVHYEFNRRSDPAQIKRLVALSGTTLEVKGRITRYFADRDPFLVKNRHPFNLFVSRWNTYAPSGRHVAQEWVDPTTPVDCRHEPPCRDDAEHTRRRNQEMRT